MELNGYKPSPLEYLQIPKFERFITNQVHSLTIESSKIIVEVLGGIYSAQKEFDMSTQYAKKIVIGGKYALIIRYQKTNSKEFRPSAYMSFDTQSDGSLKIEEIQGTKENHISYRFFTSFKVFDFFIEIIRKNFTEKGIKVYMDSLPKGLDGASYNSKAYEKYMGFKQKLDQLNTTIP